MKLSKSNRQILFLYISTVLGVFLGILVSILNTNFLRPSEYGDVRYINNILSFFSGILLFGYFVSGSRLLALSKTKGEASLIKGGLVFILGLTVVIMIIIMTICGFIYEYYLHKEFYYLFYLVIPVCSSPLLLNYINTSSQGDNSISTIASARLLPQLLYLIIGYYIYNYSGASTEKMLLLQNGVAVLVLTYLIFKNSPKFAHLKLSLKEINNENKKYGIHVYYGSLANVSVQYIAGVTLGLIGADNTEVGFYTLALTVTSPLLMLPNVIGTTYYKQFAHLNAIPKKVLIWTYIMSGLSMICFIILIYPIVDLLYNKSYSNVAYYASIMAIGFAFHGLGDVYNRFLGAHGKGKYLRNAAWISGLISILGYTLGIYYFGITAALATRILSSCCYYISMLRFYAKFKKTSI